MSVTETAPPTALVGFDAKSTETVFAPVAGSFNPNISITKVEPDVVDFLPRLVIVTLL